MGARVISVPMPRQRGHGPEQGGSTARQSGPGALHRAGRVCMRVGTAAAYHRTAARRCRRCSCRCRCLVRVLRPGRRACVGSAAVGDQWPVRGGARAADKNTRAGRGTDSRARPLSRVVLVRECEHVSSVGPARVCPLPTSTGPSVLHAPSSSPTHPAPFLSTPQFLPSSSPGPTPRRHSRPSLCHFPFDTESAPDHSHVDGRPCSCSCGGPCRTPRRPWPPPRHGRLSVSRLPPGPFAGAGGRVGGCQWERQRWGRALGP